MKSYGLNMYNIFIESIINVHWVWVEKLAVFIKNKYFFVSLGLYCPSCFRKVHSMRQWKWDVVGKIRSIDFFKRFGIQNKKVALFLWSIEMHAHQNTIIFTWSFWVGNKIHFRCVLILNVSYFVLCRITNVFLNQCSSWIVKSTPAVNYTILKINRRTWK